MRKVSSYKQGQNLDSFMVKEFNDLVLAIEEIQRRLNIPYSLPITTVIMSDSTNIDTWRMIAGQGWILADGSEVEGSGYQRVTGKNTVPDLRGQFVGTNLKLYIKIN